MASLRASPLDGLESKGADGGVEFEQRTLRRLLRWEGGQDGVGRSEVTRGHGGGVRGHGAAL